MPAVKIFIGSSMKSRRVAKHLAVLLQQESGIECQTWTDGVFELGHNFLASLNAAADTSHFAVIVFGLDDVLKTGGENSPTSDQWVPRDNVVFESGLFIRALGLDRCFLVVAEGSRVPTDLLGISYARFDTERFEREPLAALTEAAVLIEEQVRKLGIPPLGLPLGLVDHLYRQTGITQVFSKRGDAKAEILRDIETARSQVAFYARVYISEVMKDLGGLTEALRRAVLADTEGQLCVSQTNTDYRDEDLLRTAWRHERTTDPPIFQDLEQYKTHVQKSTAYLEGVHKNLESKLANTPRCQRKSLSIVQRHLTTPIPYSLIVIDECIVWVSFYWRIGDDLPYGTFAPTMRLICQGDESSWASRLVAQAHEVSLRCSALGREFPVI